MHVKELIKKLQKLDQDVEIEIAGKPSYISYSNIVIEELSEYEEDDEDRCIEGYVLKPKEQ